MIEKTILQAYPDAEVFVETPDNVHYSVVVVSDDFAGMTRIARHRAIMNLFKDALTDASIHALSLKTLTLSEWQAQQAE